MTKFLKKDQLSSNWYEIDAKNAVVGRLATVISKIIRGKNKTTFTPHMDDGDFVVVKNIEQIKFTINYPIVSALLIIFAGAMMISRVPTPSVKNLKVKTLYFRLMIIFTVIILIFLISYFWQTTLLVALIYLLFSLLSLFTYFIKFFRGVS